MMMKKFKSKIDKLYIVVLIASFAFAFSAILSEIPRSNLSSSLIYLLNEQSELRNALLILVFTFSFIAYIFLTISYKVTDKEVIIFNGLYNKVIKIEDIRKVTHTTNIISAAALSIKRLVLHHKDGEVQISPKDREEFLAAINQPLSDSL